MAQQTLNAGSPPIVWSTVEDAFTKINSNFDEIYATIGGTLGSVIDFETLNSDVSPAITETYDLGSPSFRWRDLYLSGSSLYLGSAQITANLAGIVNLPSGSTVGGELIRNPLESSFKTVAVSGQASVVADDTTDTLNLVSGNAGLSITTNALTDTVTFTSNAIGSIVGTASQIGVNTVSGVATLTNLGVLSLTGEAGGIGVSGSTGDITITNLGAKRIIAGTGMSVNPVGGIGNVTVTNEGALTSFNRVLVNGDAGNVLAADGSVSILRINSGVGVSLTKDPTTDTITISANTDFDVTGSVFGDDSSVMVDALEYKIYATNGFYGDLRGSVFADDSTLLVDAVSGIIPAAVVTGTFTGSVIGNVTGNTVGIHDGDVTGSVFADDSTLLVDGVSGQIVGPINSFDGGNSITMDPVNGVIIGGTAGAQIIGAAGAPVYIGGGASGGTTGDIFLGNGINRVLFVSNNIDTDDSSALIFEPPVTFNTNVTFDSDIAVNGQVTIGGDLIINGTTTTINSVTLTVDDKNIELGSTASPTDVTADGGGFTLKGTTDKTFTYVNSTGVWTANIGIAATSFTGLAATAATTSTAESVGYMGIPQSATATTATLVIGDAGKHIYVNTSGQTITIPANSVVAYPIGTAITFVAGPSAGSVTIANNDTMYLVGAGTTGSRTLAAYGSATAMKVSATAWFIAGTGLT